MKHVLVLALTATLSLTAATFNVATTPELRTALETAATNGEDDTIMLADGTYKTTDDGGGTFIYLSNEANKLTLIGSGSENVILSGDNLHQILNHNSTEDAPMSIEKLSFVDGNNTATTYPDNYGGGLYTDYNIEVLHCNFTNNSAQYGGGFSAQEAFVNNSTFANNQATLTIGTSRYVGAGGGFSATVTNVANSKFLKNTAGIGNGGGFVSSDTVIDKSLFEMNNADSGGAIYSGDIDITDSNFSSNVALSAGGAIQGGNIDINNSIFLENTAKFRGGGFFAYSNLINVINSTFKNNKVDYTDYSISNPYTIPSAPGGAGFKAVRDTRNEKLVIIISNTEFSNNSSQGNSASGGAVGIGATDVSLDVSNSLFKSNKASYGAGLSTQTSRSSSGTATITNSFFQDNNATEIGGAIYVTYQGIIKNNKLINNISTNGGGMYIAEGSIFNNIFLDNNATHGGAIYRKLNRLLESSYIFNNLFLNNLNTVYFEDSETNYVLNNIFKSNNQYDVNTSTSAVVDLKNNYINPDYIHGTTFISNNIFSGVNIGFQNEAIGDYNLTILSDFIDAGTTNVTGVVLPTTDLNGNARIVGGNIDIGPYEFSTTRPTINSVTYAGTTQEQQELTFTTDSIAATGRSISSVEYDYLNDGTFTTTNTYTYSTAGTYTVNVKVTDSEGEFSSTTKTVTIVELAFENMTDEQKLAKAIDPTYYDDIIAIIDTEKASSNASGVTTGENNVLLDPSAYSLVSESSIDLSITDVTAFSTGWTLTSTPFTITDLSIFDGATIIWVYNNSSATWSAYSSNATTRQKIIDSPTVNLLTTIPAGSGVWVQK